MKKNGTIKKVLADEGFGFIKCKGLQKDVFFHKSKNSTFSKLKSGQLVEFDLFKTAKGYEARNMEVCETTTIEQKVNGFIFTKNHKPKYGTVTRSTYIESPWFNSPQEGRNYLEKAAKHAGCNAILSLACERQERSKGGNHYGTYHSFNGYMAVVTENVAIKKDELSESFKESQRIQLNAIQRRAKLESLSSRSQKDDQDSFDPHQLFSALFIFFVIAAIVFGNS
ncbi:cold shock domain-containing protein [Ferrimonas lipolytica]|uniref:Cold shock domain-containing protein n=1 Tax=Ferrimonas lipolytica TaxID=2724191 RepID=A0A6H1UCQ9_9GAMM|nr:cold shock domain-containing protein [Ferrimonas lipolytica]QIZ76824.1 cold shock domain-containing protein [Ferrimonas lipolytica]